jgi:hypothetical protein
VSGSYPGYMPARSPTRPTTRPLYRVMVKKKVRPAWDELPQRVGTDSAQQFWDHVAYTPGAKARVNSSNIMKGKYGTPQIAGGARTVHYRISGAGRIDYTYHNKYVGVRGDEHRVSFILMINHGSH